MRFVIKTSYDRRAMTAMARTVRKMLHRRRSMFTHIFGWTMILIELYVLINVFIHGSGMTPSNWVTFVSALIIIIVIFAEDRLNGWYAGQRMNHQEVETVVTPSGYVATTRTGELRWSHEQVKLAFETPEYFVFFFHTQHVQMYDKNSFIEGTPDGFRKFVTEMSKKTIQPVK